MTDLISPSYVTSLTNITDMYLTCEQSLFLAIVAEIGSLCSEKYYEHVHYFISLLGELIDLHDEDKYQRLIEKYLDHIVYADLTDHFISYPIVLQIQVMAIIESTPLLQFPLMNAESESDQPKIDLFLRDAGKNSSESTSSSTRSL